MKKIKLSEEQKGFVPWFYEQSQRNRCLKLIGYAGTGKTTVMRELDKAWEGLSLWCCPSHEAKNILSGKLHHSRAITLASALGMGPMTIDGKSKFVPMYPSKINNLVGESFTEGGGPVLVVVDESSMIDKNYLRYLLDSPADIILFVGDSAQIPPINYKLSPIYDESCNYPTYELTKIFRQAEGSNISLLAYDTRIEGVDSSLERGIETIGLSEPEIMNFYRKFPDGIALCPTHKIKDTCNKIARKMLNNGNPPSHRYIKEEYLFLESPVDPPNGPTNGSKVKIVSDPVQTIFQGFVVWKMDVTGDSLEIDGEEVGKKYIINVPFDEKERKSIEGHLRVLEKEFKNASDVRKSEINREVEILTTKVTFASHGFAMTIHKSQGSTFRHVLLCVSGIDNWRKSGIHINMVYTGITRAAKTLIIGR